jgi:Glycosyltransferase family 87/WD40-like Beta Propeller Repeat
MESTISTVLSESKERRTSGSNVQPRSWHWLRRSIVVVEWIALVAGTAYLGGRSLPRAWQTLNTDFPNYYTVARLLREGYSTERVYEWLWIQRQKDHLGIGKADQPIVGFVPLTPFSALPVLPLTYWAPLTAKHVWIVLNLGLLGGIAAVLHSLTGLAWRRIALLTVLNLPMHHNLLYGQYYVVLLLLLTLALWLYVRGKPTLAGVLMGIAFGLKIFPVFFVLYFVRKRDWRAAVGLIAGSVAAGLASIAAFGLQLNRVFAFQVLPWALRGDAMDPYNLGSGSLSSLLHRLLIFEPEWNPHPLLNAPTAFAVLHPLLQILIFAPALFLVIPKDSRPQQVRLEWSAFLLALLAISTLPASYHFTLLILPVGVIVSVLLDGRNYRALALLAFLYLAICIPGWKVSSGDGLHALAGVPRLYFVILLCLFSYAVLAKRERPAAGFEPDRWLWSAALACGLVLQIATTLHHQRSLYHNYSSRLATSPAVFLATAPLVQGDLVRFIAMLPDGYHTAEHTPGNFRSSTSDADQLALTMGGDRLWVEESNRESKIISIEPNEAASKLEVAEAESPVASRDGKWLAYLRSDRGRSRVWVRSLQGVSPFDGPITPQDLDVSEMAFLPDDSVIFAASQHHGPPHLFVGDRAGTIRQFSAEEARFPAASVDGHWLAYSRQQSGVWNLWVRDLHSDKTYRVTHADCNDLSPTWEADLKTLVFATDCGRALWLTGLSRRQVVP